MTYGQAKKDFALFAVFVPTKNRKLEQVDFVPEDAEGRVAAFDLNQDYPMAVAPRLCFIVNEEYQDE